MPLEITYQSQSQDFTKEYSEAQNGPKTSLITGEIKDLILIHEEVYLNKLDQLYMCYKAYINCIDCVWLLFRWTTSKCDQSQVNQVVDLTVKMLHGM